MTPDLNSVLEAIVSNASTLQVDAPNAQRGEKQRMNVRLVRHSTRQGLRFQPGCLQTDAWLRMHRSGRVTAFDAQSPQKLEFEATIECPQMLENLRKMDAALRTNVMQHAPAWWPHVTDAKRLVQSMWQPFVQQKRIDGVERSTIKLCVAPWSTQGTRLLRWAPHAQPTCTDVTELVEGAELFPILTVTEVCCHAQIISPQVQVTDLLIRFPSQPRVEHTANVE